MYRNAVVLMILGASLQACATASVDVSHEPPPVPPKFTSVAVPPFANAVGSALPGTAADELAGAVIAKLQKDYPTAFRDVTATPSNQSGELIVRGSVVSYDPGSKAARFILIGLGAGDLKLDVTLVDAQADAKVEAFSTDGAIVAGGVVGASMGMEDMIDSAAGQIAKRVAAYGESAPQE